MHKKLRYCGFFLLSLLMGLPGYSDTNTVSVPAGFVRIEIPENDGVWAALPFDPFDASVQMIFSNQLTGATNQSLADIIRFWDLSGQAYSNAWKADNTGDSGKDGKWFEDFTNWVESPLTFLSGDGFYIENQQAQTQSVFLCGTVLTAETNALSLVEGLARFGFPFSTKCGANDTTLLADGAIAAAAQANADEITDHTDNEKVWLKTGATTNWVDEATGETSSEELLLGKGYTYTRRGGSGTLMWNQTRPYSNPFPSNEDPPALFDMQPNGAGDEMTLSIDTTGDAGEELDIFYQDLSETSAFVSAGGWLIAETNIATSGSTHSWTDDGSGGRGKVDTVYSRFYLVGRADIDTDNDGLPDARETFYHGTDANDPDSDDDGLSDGAEIATYGTDPLDTDTDNDGMSDGVEVLHGQDPAVPVGSTYAALPFTETFDSLTAGNLHDQNYWTCSPPAKVSVQSSTVYAGSQAMELQENDPSATAKHFFGAEGEPVVWSDLYAQPVRRAGDAPSLDDVVTAAFHVDGDGQLVVYDGSITNWTTLTGHSAIVESTWIRLTVKQVFTNQTWRLSLDGVLVAQNLGFATNAIDEYSFCKFEGGIPGSGYVDSFAASTTEPDGLDDDDDGMANKWEDLYGLDRTDPDDASDDNDNDGLDNLTEYQLGTCPTDTDSDADAMGDYAEVQHGKDPAVYNYYSVVPFLEDFENVDPGDINHQRNWSASPADTIVAQSATVHQGTQAAEIGAAGEAPLLRHFLAAEGEPVVWSDLYCRLIYYEGPEPERDDTTTATFYVNGSGQLVVYDGSTWTTLTEHDAIAEDTWVRLTVRQDFTNQTWDLYLDDNVVAEDLGFATNHMAEYSFCAVMGSVAYEDYLDDFAVTLTQPSFDRDHDGLSDEWETEHFGGATNAVADEDYDSDGLSNLLEYQYGTTATTNDTDGDTVADGDEIANKTNPLLADSDGDGVNDNTDPNPVLADQNSNPGDISITARKPEEDESILW